MSTTPLDPNYIFLLEGVLAKDFVPHLPALENQTKPAIEVAKKNLSRAFSAFALQKICKIPPAEAAAAVVDDFNDFGIDAIYYQANSETLYLVQGKLKASAFTQADANAFCQGVRRLIKQDFDGFNIHVIKREPEIEGALEMCSHIQLIVAHVGGISDHANTAINDLMNDDHGEERLSAKIIDYDATRVVADLHGGQTHPLVDTILLLRHSVSSKTPRTAYFGLVNVGELVALHRKHGEALYAKNIRLFLGQNTEINRSIRETLASNPSDFVYLNNGVTILVQQIKPKVGIGAARKFQLKGLSVINGAQTIASSASYASDNRDVDISAANVMVTLIEADCDDAFGKAVTKARNHQNPVMLANFAALDDEQERLRREIAYLDIRYSYKAEGVGTVVDSRQVRIDEAAHALALLQPDPRYAVWLKTEPSRFLDTESELYRSLFPKNLTGVELVNAVRVLRYLQSRAFDEAATATGVERLAYRHGFYALGFILAKRLRDVISAAALIDESKLASQFSAPFDAARQELWVQVQSRIGVKGPLAIFRNLTDSVPLLRDAMLAHYGFAAAPISPLLLMASPTDAYPQKALFDLLSRKAPQVAIINE